ncbi:MAG: MFS transporter [Bacteroidetes bacterium]|nr:MAG: MFS transporter [Bacteroidota bacterium]
MKFAIGFKLSIMMFLEYFIWGSWYVTLGTYMGEHFHDPGIDKTIGYAYSALAVATMISPFFVGMVADRFFSAQKIMGVLHIIGAVILYFTTTINDSSVLPWIVLLYSLLYMPTIALSNSVAFGQMSDPGKQFPWIRVFGTLGWIAAGTILGLTHIEKESTPFLIASGVSLLLGLFSFLLPNTPPKGKEADAASKALGVEAFVLFKNGPYLIFFIAAILVCIPLSFYFGFANPFLNELGVDAAAFKMTLGQYSEAAFIISIPFLFNSIGVKKMVLLGMTAWILRYACFAFGNVDTNLWMLYAGIILHGICYDFFFVTGYMYTEKKAGPKIKASAQGLFTFATYGVGMFIGTWVSGQVVNHYKSESGHDWMKIWFVPAYIAVAVLIYFILFFKEKKQIEQAS